MTASPKILFKRAARVHAAAVNAEGLMRGTPMTEVECARSLLDTEPALLISRVRAEIQLRARSDIDE